MLLFPQSTAHTCLDMSATALATTCIDGLIGPSQVLGSDRVATFGMCEYKYCNLSFIPSDVKSSLMLCTLGFELGKDEKVVNRELFVFDRERSFGVNGES
jgi:hypothetical protein